MHWSFFLRKEEVMKIILTDSSFLISYLDEREPFSRQSIFINEAISNLKNEARILIPSIVFFETIFKLNQLNFDQEEIKNILWNALFQDQIFNVTLSETSAFRLFKKYPQEKLKGFKTSDYLILSTALAFDAHLITYDKKLRRNAGEIYDKVYYCDPYDKEFGHDTGNLLRKISLHSP